MLLRVVLVVMAMLWTGSLFADEGAGQQRGAKLDAQAAVELGYLLYLPPDYDQIESWPLLLFLHGGGERGDDLELVKMHGPPKLIAEGREFPFIVISPQCPKNKSWESMALVALLDDISRRYKVDPDRVYVTGLSLGGFGSWKLAEYAPERLAAIVPICGGGEAYWTKQYPHLAVWAFHGAKDPGVPLRRSQEMIDALIKNGGNPKFTIYPDGEHNVWAETYENPQLYEWLLSQKRQRRE